MLSKEFVETEEHLFQGASCSADEEDWTTIQEVLAERNTLKSARRVVQERHRRYTPVEGIPTSLQPIGCHSSSVVTSIISKPRPMNAQSQNVSLTSGQTYAGTILGPSAESPTSSGPGCMDISATFAGYPASHVQVTGNASVTSGTPRLNPTLSEVTVLSLDDSGDILTPQDSTASGSSFNKDILTKKRKGASLESFVGRLTKQKTVSATSLESNKHLKRKPTKNAEMNTEMNYLEYALSLSPRVSALQKSSGVSIFAGLVVYLLVEEHMKGPKTHITKATRIRLDLLAANGVTPAPSFAAESVTHVISDLPAAQTAKLLGYKCTNDIPCEIRVVRWAWVTNCINQRCLVDQIKAERFPKRLFSVDLRKPDSSHPGGPAHSPVEASVGSQSSQERGLPSPISSPQRVASKEVAGPDANVDVPCDILAQFIEQAMEEQGEESSDDPRGEGPGHGQANPDADYGVDEGAIVNRSAVDARLGYACKNVGPSTKGHFNDDIIEKLQALIEIHESTVGDDQQWRVISYRKAINTLRRYPARVQSADEAANLPGIGAKTAEKIMEIVQTGDLRRIKFEQTERSEVCKVLRGVYGVGIKTAHSWYDRGIRSLDDLEQGKCGITLTQSQRIGLELYDDLQERMPREEASAIFEKIRIIGVKLDPAVQMEVTGSYRRGSSTCGDIDILLTRPNGDGNNHSGLLKKLIRSLKEQGLVTHTLAAPDDWNDLEAKFMGICRLGREQHYKYRRIDILTIPYPQWGAALLYFTGDDIFNRSMRLLANHKGLSLNQRGLWQDVSRDPKTRVKTSIGTLIASRTEEEIFAALGVPWQQPPQRIRGR